MALDPAAASFAFATIVGLICNFKQERGASASASRDDFNTYLEAHRHEEIKNLIAQTQFLSEEVDRLLREDHAVIIAKLDTASAMLAQIASRIEGLAGISRALMPEQELSQQAVGILRALYSSSANGMGEVRSGDGAFFVLTDNTGQITAPDQRYLQDDMEALCRLGLLSRDRTSRGTPLYRLTRAAARFLESAAPTAGTP